MNFLPALALLIAVSHSARADDVSVPNTFTADTTISSSQMNANFEALVQESNENDALIVDQENRITTLEGASPQIILLPYWVDSQGKKVGLANTINSGPDDSLLYKFPESPRVFETVFQIDGGEPNFSGFIAARVYFESNDCSGQGYLFLSNYSDLRNKRGLLQSGVSVTGKRVIPDIDNFLQWGDEEFFSYTDIALTGEVSCDQVYGFDDWRNDYIAPTIESSVDATLGITPPLHLEWR